LISLEYFNNIANEWDSLRKNFYPENLKTRIFSKVKPISGSIIADIGAGTGFLTENLYNDALKIICIDQSIQMLKIIQRKFPDANNIQYLNCQCENIQLSDSSVDYVFSNMLLHHVEDPLSVIFEMTRILKPGGTLTITDLETHSQIFLAAEMHDRWLGFKPKDVEQWFLNVGLVNISIELLDDYCCASAKGSGDSSPIGIILATGEKI
jgi:ubiquinone/menaquinone biosynthesis C-methylase UbiE